MAGNGYATTSRKKILEYLMANSDRTVTVTDIDQYLKKHDNEVNITTIYRYLDKLAKEGKQKAVDYQRERMDKNSLYY